MQAIQKKIIFSEQCWRLEVQLVHEEWIHEVDLASNFQVPKKNQVVIESKTVHQDFNLFFFLSIIWPINGIF